MGLFLFKPDFKTLILKTYNLKTESLKLISDAVTPVSIYLKLRDKLSGVIMLESSDYHGEQNSFSYICCNPIASFMLKGTSLKIECPDGEIKLKDINYQKDAIAELSEFRKSFKTEKTSHKFISNGLFGYMSYDAVQHFEDISFNQDKEDEYKIPDILYKVYRNVIAINHFKNEMYLFDHQLEGSEEKSNIEDIERLIKGKNFPYFGFEALNNESSNLTNEEYIEMVNKGIQHCFRGDVFQIVLARRFNMGFKGDEFMVYRALRAINPSPYLFYFDYGSFKLFGSSPEAQIVIDQGKATIYPIAGTFKRTGDDEADGELARKLFADPKENSEHVMLVDLARNDLSRHGDEVTVEKFKEIQYYSHVIHLVSKVTGKMSDDTKTVQMVADTFPAGTLSGAPKHKAMELIDTYEPTRRGYYGGAIGYLGFDGEFNHAIMIRSLLSKNNVLYYQAGAGVVAKSNAESELQEVNNKLAALRTAIEKGQNIQI